MSAISSVARLCELASTIREALRALLMDLRAHAAVRAAKAWVTHKEPLAAYWKALSVLAGRTARSLR
jgi:hypothetical protein